MPECTQESPESFKSIFWYAKLDQQVCAVVRWQLRSAGGHPESASICLADKRVLVNGREYS